MIINESVSRMSGIPDLAKSLLGSLANDIEYCDMSDAGTLGIHMNSGTKITVYSIQKVRYPYKEGPLEDFTEIRINNKTIFKGSGISESDLSSRIQAAINK